MPIYKRAEETSAANNNSETRRNKMDDPELQNAILPIQFPN